MIIPDVLQGRDHLFKIGKHEYLSFANVEDRRRYTLSKLQRDAYRFLPLGFISDTLMVRHDLVLAAVNGDPLPDERRRAINNLVEASGSWKLLYNATIERFGYQIVLGCMDQMGCSWVEEASNPQLSFRIAADSVGYRTDDVANFKHMAG